MDIQIVPLNNKTYEEVVRIAVEGATGEEKDIRPRLRFYHRYFTAIFDSKVVGEIGWYQDDGTFAGIALKENFPYGSNVYWIGHFAVEKDYRGRKIGTKLLTYLENVVKRLGAKEVWVYTSQARGFYEKRGFVFVQKGQIDDAWEDFLKKPLV